MSICYLIGSFSPFIDFTPNCDDLVIAIDQGYQFLKEKEIRIDIIIGDFDSLGYVPNEPNVVILPVEKDLSDMEAGMDIGLQRGYQTFYFYGASGGRLSHTFANIQLLTKLANLGKQGFIKAEKELLTVICDSSITLEKSKGYLSVFALSSCAIVSEQGVKYPLDSYHLTNTTSRGLSNQIVDDFALISVKNGNILVMVEKP